MSRIMQQTKSVFVNARDIAAERIAAVEGAKEHGDVTVKVLHVGQETLMLEVFRKQGLIDPVHRHDDHETVAYLIEGQLRVKIGDEEFIAEPGSSWRHPVGVDHYSEALTDCRQIEVKSPPRKTWVSK
ncbi:MAG: cupin domain-containing protein [Alphaproteobacteria bacterium]|nr:cupin domain-containing protein [Alphaproteobacteria bacterium]